MAEANCAQTRGTDPSTGAWALLGAAIAGEISGVVGLRFSEGFTEPWQRQSRCFPLASHFSL